MISKMSFSCLSTGALGCTNYLSITMSKFPDVRLIKSWLIGSSKLFIFNWFDFYIILIEFILWTIQICKLAYFLSKFENSDHFKTQHHGEKNWVVSLRFKNICKNYRKRVNNFSIFIFSQLNHKLQFMTVSMHNIISFTLFCNRKKYEDPWLYPIVFVAEEVPYKVSVNYDFRAKEHFCAINGRSFSDYPY